MNNKTGMDLRKRIGIAFVLTILISVVFFAVLYAVLVRFTVRTIGKEYDINNPSIENLYNNTLLVSRKMDEEILEILDIVRDNPEKLGDKDFLSETNEKMQENVSFLVTTRENEVYFNGSDALPYRYLKELLDLERTVDREDDLTEKTGAEAAVAGSGENILSGQTANGSLYRQIRIRYPDEAEGSLFLVSTLDRVAPAIRWWLIETILLILIVLAIVSLLMGNWIYRGVEKPIRELKTATQNIRDGNLDFNVKNSGIEELDDLCQDFEEMRIRLKESAESKVEADRQSRELISNITHDLKTPITTIQGYVEGILDGVADTPEKMEHYLLTIRNKARDIDQLINELTVYSNITTDRIPYNYTRLQVSEYFSDCVEELSMDLEEQNIRLEYNNLLQKDAVIIADPEQLKRVINNIVGNSVKYADPEKEETVIRIRLRDVGDFIQIEIEDNGKGIAQKDLNRVFDRLYRGDASRGSQGGSGIGLSIVKKIIEDHEGKVWATSKEGEGTVIYFVLRKYS